MKAEDKIYFDPRSFKVRLVKAFEGEKNTDKITSNYVKFHLYFCCGLLMLPFFFMWFISNYDDLGKFHSDDKTEYSGGVMLGGFFKYAATFFLLRSYVLTSSIVALWFAILLNLVVVFLYCYKHIKITSKTIVFEKENIDIK